MGHGGQIYSVIEAEKLFSLINSQMDVQNKTEYKQMDNHAEIKTVGKCCYTTNYGNMPDTDYDMEKNSLPQ